MSDIPKETLKQAAGGHVESFEEIYKAYAGYVYNVVYRIVENLEDAKEVTQDVFLTIYKQLENFRFNSSFKTWIYRISVNASINYVKKRNKERNRTVELNEEIHMVNQTNQVENKIDKQFNEKIIDTFLNKLNEDQRACIVLRSMEGFSYQEIADTLNININTVRTRIKRARETILAIRNEVVRNEM